MPPRAPKPGQSLADLYPEIAPQWHGTKNGDLTPEGVFAGSGRKVWWDCGKPGHEWEATVNNRMRGRGCPFCSGKRVLVGFNDLATTHPTLADQWHGTKNGNLAPKDVSAGARQKAWWLGECGHEWEATVSNRTRGNGCPFCSNRQILVGFNDLATTHPFLASQWYSTKNGDLTPKDVSAGSHQKVWWDCGKPGHEWKATVGDRTRGNGCPFCSNRQILVGFNDLATTHPSLADQWHGMKNGDLTPKDVSAGSHQKVWWDCGKPGHEWEATVNDRTQGKGCPFCSGRVPIVGFNDLATTHRELAKQWHSTKNGDLTPEGVTAGSNKKVWWDCGKPGHEWEARVGDRTQGNGCPHCYAESTTSKAENEIADIIEVLLVDPDLVSRNIRTVGDITEMDIYVLSRNFAVEFNGVYWHSQSPEGVPAHERIHPKYHLNKSIECKENSIDLVHIWSDDYTRNPDLVARTIARALRVEDSLLLSGVLTTPKSEYVEFLKADQLAFSHLDTDYASEFMKENSLKRNADGYGEYYGLTDANGDVRAAISVVETGSMFTPELLITGFATLGVIPGALGTLITNLSERYGVRKFTFTVDPSSDDIRAIRAAGFIDTGEREEPTLYACNNENRYDPEDENKPANAVRRLWDEGREMWELKL